MSPPLTDAQIACFSEAIAGRVTRHSAADYEQRRRALVWNGRPPERYPQLIVEAHSAADVATAVDFARRHGLIISARGTGHSYSAIFLNHGGLLLDLSRLDEIVVDPQAHRVSVGAGARSGNIGLALAARGLAFPVGHDGEVGIGGFLLGGGLGINCAAWGGMSTFNILAAEVVTADGRILHVSSTDHPDLFWALRGGGPGLPFIVTRFLLRCYDHPGVIANNSWLFRPGDLPRLARELDAAADRFDQRLQIMIALIPTPPGLAGEEGERIAALSAIAFAQDRDDARAILQPLSSLPVFARALAAMETPTTTFAGILEQGKTLLVAQRFRTDNVLCDDLSGAVTIILRHLSVAPSPTSVSLIVWRGEHALPQAAYSVSGRYFISTYTQWDSVEDDLPNARWLRSFYDDMAAIATGAYINEFDLESRASEVSRCYSADAFARLHALRQRCDPDGVFYNPCSSLTP